MLGQFLLQKLAHFFDQQSLVFISYQIRRQMFVALIFAGHDGGFAHGVMFGQRSFDLAQLDAEPAHFDLVVDASDELYITVIPITRQIASLVESRARLSRKRIGHEPLGIQFGPFQIAAGHAVAARVKLSRHANGLRIHVRIQHVYSGVRDGTSDRHRAVDLSQIAHRITTGESRVLGRTVPIDQAALRQLFEDFAHMRH